MIPGDPSLSVSNEGFITVTPTEIGLYVFSVKADEYRDGIKIGEARRDFQMLVVDGCNPPDPPEALVKVPGQEEYYQEDDTIIYVASQPKCFDFFVTDDIGTDVTLNAIGVNFGKGGKSDLNDIFSFSKGSINNSGDTLKVQVCVSDCPYLQNEPYLIDLIAADDACPLPQRDTVRVTLIVEPPTNRDPFFINQKDTNFVTLPWNSSFSTVIKGQDIDLDSLSLNYFVIPSKINLDDYGISFNKIEDIRGSQYLKATEVIETSKDNKLEPQQALLIVADKTFLKPISIVEITEDKSGSEYRGRSLPLYKIEAINEESEEINVYLDPYSEEVVAIRSNQWRIWDFMWGIHIMDWNERDNIGNIFLKVFSILALLSALSGIYLFFVTNKRQ